MNPQFTNPLRVEQEKTILATSNWHFWRFMFFALLSVVIIWSVALGSSAAASQSYIRDRDSRVIVIPINR